MLQLVLLSNSSFKPTGNLIRYSGQAKLTLNDECRQGPGRAWRYLERKHLVACFFSAKQIFQSAFRLMLGNVTGHLH